jgi:hypothetical protein
MDVFHYVMWVKGDKVDKVDISALEALRNQLQNQHADIDPANLNIPPPALTE